MAVLVSAGMDYEPSHFGICVSDLGRSMRFYCDGLGFTKMVTYECGDEFEPSLEVSGPIGLTAQFTNRGGAWSSSSCTTRRRPFGFPVAAPQPAGPHAPVVRVDDVDAAAKRLAEYGGRILPTTRVIIDTGMESVFLEDPDGTRIELDNAHA